MQSDGSTVVSRGNQNTVKLNSDSDGSQVGTTGDRNTVEVNGEDNRVHVGGDKTLQSSDNNIVVNGKKNKVFVNDENLNLTVNGDGLQVEVRDRQIVAEDSQGYEAKVIKNADGSYQVRPKTTLEWIGLM